MSVTPHDTYGVLCAVMSRNRDGLRRAGLHIGSVRRCDNRRISMCPIPGNIRCLRVTDIAGYRLRKIDRGFARRWPVAEVVPYPRPEDLAIVSPVMPERVGGAGMRMRRSKPSAMRCSRPGERLVRGKHKRDCAERRDKRSIHSVRHGTHQSVGYRAAPQRTLGVAVRASKCIINY